MRVPRTTEREYAAAILRALAPAREAIAYLSEGALAMLPQRQDADEHERMQALIREAEAILQRGMNQTALQALALNFASRASTDQREQLRRQVVAAIGIDPIAADPTLGSRLAGFSLENAALIKDIGVQSLSRVAGHAIRAVNEGQRHENLAKILQEERGYSERRAKLIARDQVGKIYSQLNAERQKDMGITEFIWRTVHDDRVRKEHRELDGQKFKYSKLPSEGLPGTPIQCRCYAEPVFEDIEPVAPSRPREPEPAPSYEALSKSRSGARTVRTTAERLPPIVDLNGMIVQSEFLKVAERARIERVASGIASGAVKAPIVVAVHGSGKHEIVQGRHRLLALLERFPGKRYPVRFVQGSKNL